MCHIPQTKRKIGISENGRPTRRKMHEGSSIHLLRSQYVRTNLDKRKTMRPRTFCCSLYMFHQLCCSYWNYQYNRCWFIHYGIAEIQEVQFNQYSQIMEQTFLLPVVNYRKHWQRWIILKSRIACKEKARIRSCGSRNHLEHHICEVCVNAKFEQQEVSWEDC